MPKLFWRNHDSLRVRVWREDWAGDQFEVMPRDSLQSMIALGIEVEEAEEGDAE